MGGSWAGVGEKDYVLLSKNLKVELGRNDDDEDANGCFSLCFWLYIDNCASFPSVILEQKHPDALSCPPLLWLDEKKKMMLFPLVFLHQEAPSLDNCIPWAGVPCASENEFPVKKWVHVGCEFLRDLVRLRIDGEIVGERSLTCTLDKFFFWMTNNSTLDKESNADALKKLYFACPDEIEDKFHGYVHGLDVLFPLSAVKDHHVKDPPVRLSIDHSSASEVEEDSDGVWNIVGGKASCRRIFSLNVSLLDAFSCPVIKNFEVVASLLYADNQAPVENTGDAEPPLLVCFDGIEYASHDRPCTLVSGCAVFKLKISQLSSKCDNRLFRIRFSIPELGLYPFLETLSVPIRCVSRGRTTKTASLSQRKSSNRIDNVNGWEGNAESMELIPNIVREVKPSPSSKRVKLGQDKPFGMLKDDLPLKLPNSKRDSHASTSNEDNTTDWRLENHYGAENNSSTSNTGEASNSDPKKMLDVSSPFLDLIIFKYCLGSHGERCLLLKEIATSVCEKQLENFAEQVSLFSGCLHHRHQIRISKRLIEEGIQAWTSISNNNSEVLWNNLISSINEEFLKIARCTRSLTNQEFEFLRRIAGCEDLVYQENFERMWCWLYPVALTLSQSVVTAVWDSVSPIWMEGFVSKEEAESALRRPGGGLEDPGTFVLRFPASRSWPHPDAGNIVITYVGIDYTFHHRLLSHDFIYSSSQKMHGKPLNEMLLQEPELSRLGRMTRN